MSSPMIGSTFDSFLDENGIREETEALALKKIANEQPDYVMGAHLINGEFQSDKYPTCPPGKVPLSVKDPTAQDLLWEYAQRRRSVDAEFSHDLEMALLIAGYAPTPIEQALFETRSAKPSGEPK